MASPRSPSHTGSVMHRRSTVVRDIGRVVAQAPGEAERTRAHLVLRASRRRYAMPVTEPETSRTRRSVHYPPRESRCRSRCRSSCGGWAAATTTTTIRRRPVTSEPTAGPWSSTTLTMHHARTTSSSVTGRCSSMTCPSPSLPDDVVPGGVRRRIRPSGGGRAMWAYELPREHGMVIDATLAKAAVVGVPSGSRRSPAEKPFRRRPPLLIRATGAANQLAVVAPCSELRTRRTRSTQPPRSGGHGSRGEAPGVERS